MGKPGCQNSLPNQQQKGRDEGTEKRMSHTSIIYLACYFIFLFPGSYVPFIFNRKRTRDLQKKKEKKRKKRDDEEQTLSNAKDLEKNPPGP